MKHRIYKVSSRASRNTEHSDWLSSMGGNLTKEGFVGFVCFNIWSKFLTWDLNRY